MWEQLLLLRSSSWLCIFSWKEKKEKRKQNSGPSLKQQWRQGMDVSSAERRRHTHIGVGGSVHLSSAREKKYWKVESSPLVLWLSKWLRHTFFKTLSLWIWKVFMAKKRRPHLIEWVSYAGIYDALRWIICPSSFLLILFLFSSLFLTELCKFQSLLSSPSRHKFFKPQVVRLCGFPNELEKAEIWREAMIKRRRGKLQYKLRHSTQVESNDPFL